MPVVEAHPDELRRLIGRSDLDDETLRTDLFALGLEFEGMTEDGAFELELEPDRLDRLSPTGIARSLRYQYGIDRGLTIPNLGAADWTIEVDASVPDERPYVTGAVVRGLDLDEQALDALLQLQEKLHATMGRGRAKGAIGVHDLTMLKGEVIPGQDPEESVPAGKRITYRGIEPDGDRFVPLEGADELTPGEVLTDHHIGRDYAELVAGYERYPAIYDDVGLFSFPPVVNGQRTEVSTDSRDLLIELTGTDQWTIDRMCTIICYALDARGGQVEGVEVAYPDRTLSRPDFETRTKKLSIDRVESMLGVSLSSETVIDLAERAGLDAELLAGPEEPTLAVTVPPYRTDVRHPVDLVDDIGRAYGFNELEPRYPDVGTVGSRSPESRRDEAVRGTLVGLGFEDLLNFHLTSRESVFTEMNLEPTDEAYGAAQPVSIREPYSEAYEILRPWLLPSLVSVLSNNTHRSYPQDLAEVGFVGHGDEDVRTRVRERTAVAAVLARPDASYEDAKARVAALANRFDVSLNTPPTEHPSFIDGRIAAVVLDGEQVGIVGELHPSILVDHGLEVPVAAFEFDVTGLSE